MSRSRNWFVVVMAAGFILGFGTEAWAWGPVTHVKFASDLMAHLWLLPASVAAFITQHRKFFVFGNVATDTVFAKKMSKVKQVCHKWTTGFRLLDSARSDAGRAFAYGYLAHLAADTVAHNKFLPRQMAMARSTVTLGHLYWEIRADALVERSYWKRLRTHLRERYAEPEEMLKAHLRETMLSFRTNMVLFRRMNLLASLRGWHRSVEFWSRLSRATLDPVVLECYRREALDRIADVLTNGASSEVLHEDPCGNGALAYAKAQRKQLRQMLRARLPLEHVLIEAAAGHAPSERYAPALVEA